jgi:hypothetical protein
VVVVMLPQPRHLIFDEWRLPEDIGNVAIANVAWVRWNQPHRSPPISETPMDENNQILECDFAFKRPQQWENLRSLDHPDQRFCESCDRKVYFVRTRQELAVYQRQGHCIAANVNHPDFGGKGTIIVGGVAPYTQAGTLKIHLFGEQDDVNDLMVVLDQVQRNGQAIGPATTSTEANG